VEAQPETAKADMIRKLRLVHGVVRIVDYYGKTMQILLLYDSEESRSRAVELISRITNAERVTLIKSALPGSQTKRLTETDVAIIQALAMDARKPYATVAKELGFSIRTVKNRVEKLRREKTLFTYPELNMGLIPGLIPASLYYSYTNADVKESVDRAVRSHFDENYLWGFSDSEHAILVLSLIRMADVQNSVDWAKEQPGIAIAQLNIQTSCTTFPEKMAELLGRRLELFALQQNQ